MKGFHLFDEEHRSSYPLNIAYKAAQLADKEKADLFLYNLRHATVLETRQTTLTAEILNVAKETGINTALFMKHFSDGSAEAAFFQDLQYTRSLGIYSLPTYLIQKGTHSVLITQLIDFESFESVIAKLG
ncbi:DsbA family protein [[Clostridium] aminophilum]|uniref:DsbA family protein n=1 Tax=[Clostridium] aminophilum TaxID=1526 RepID=UPI0033245326